MKIKDYRTNEKIKGERYLIEVVKHREWKRLDCYDKPEGKMVVWKLQRTS